MAGEHYDLSGFAVPEGVEELHDLLDRVGEEHPGLDPSDLMLFETAVVEIANNVVEHGRPQGGVRWRFTLDVHDDRLEATLSDSGEASPMPTDTEMPDVLAESGRGLPLAYAILDEIEYSRGGDANHWRMVRLRTSAPPRPTDPTPVDALEVDRVAAVRALNMLDTRTEERFDRVVRLAQHIFGVPFAAVNLIDSDRQFTKAAAGDRFGAPSTSRPRTESLCSVTVNDDRTLEIADLRGDPTWAEHPVTQDGDAGYYVGAPLRAPCGQRIGALCLVDTGPRAELSVGQHAMLRDLANWVERELAISQDLEQGAELQRRLLPRTLPDLPGWQVDGECVQAGAVGGDFYDWQVLRDRHAVQVVLADVMGKGVQAALLAAGVRAIVRGTSPHNTLEASVRRVADDMDGDLSEMASFVTLFAARFDPADGAVEYIDAGHGLAFIVGPERGVRLPGIGMPLGALPGEQWHAVPERIGPGEALVIVSDGLLDIHGESDAVLAAVRTALADTGTAKEMVAALARSTSGPQPSDDVTVVVIRRT